mgnify:CR=1 FL=1
MVVESTTTTSTSTVSPTAPTIIQVLVPLPLSLPLPPLLPLPLDGDGAGGLGAGLGEGDGPGGVGDGDGGLGPGDGPGGVGDGGLGPGEGLGPVVLLIMQLFSASLSLSSTLPSLVTTSMYCMQRLRVLGVHCGTFSVVDGLRGESLQRPNQQYGLSRSLLMADLKYDSAGVPRSPSSSCSDFSL